ncbi:MAG TPA: hypothetical protein VNK94_00165 [Gaiellaceae bacterium]|nr:hypothetical protein [Gaiellaceae bacterium]
MARVWTLLLGGTFAAAAVASSASAAFFFLFTPTSARPGDEVVVRTGGTPEGFTPAQREPPLQRPLRLYLVPSWLAGAVRSPADRRIHFVGVLVPDRQGRGLLSFQLPPVASGDYTMARWCRTCSSGITFFVTPGGPGSGLPEADRTLLRVDMPSARDRCPATIPRDPRGRYGNGLLSTRLGRSGYLLARREPDGTLFQKLSWVPRTGLTGLLAVRGERLDAPGRMRVLAVSWGFSSNGRGSWASAVTFPSEGCWLIGARVGDVALSYVASVVGR